MKAIPTQFHSLILTEGEWSPWLFTKNCKDDTTFNYEPRYCFFPGQDEEEPVDENLTERDYQRMAENCQIPDFESINSYDKLVDELGNPEHMYIKKSIERHAASPIASPYKPCGKRGYRRSCSPN